jgi:Leucine-rich repeat (LRR) protein
MKRQFVILFYLLLSSAAIAQQPNWTVCSWEVALKSTQPDTIRAITLAKNKLEVVPNELERFIHLEYLDLSRNRLANLPDFLSSMSKLTSLDLSKNRLDIFPLVLTRISSLEKLILNRNQFDRLPESIEALQNLKYLDLWDTPVTIFPEGFYKLSALEKLDLSGIRYSPKFQEKMKERLPRVQIVFDAPCDCLD